MTPNGRPQKRGIPEGLWIQCPQCKATLFRKDVEAALNVCPQCQHHFKVSAGARICQLLDPDSFEEWFAQIKPIDALSFVDRLPYADRLLQEQTKTGLTDAAVVGKGFIRGRPVVLGITDF